MALTEPAVTWQTCGGGFAMNNIIASRPLLDGKDLDAAIDHARAALAALLRVPGGGDGAGYPKMLAEARALLGALLDHRVASRRRAWTSGTPMRSRPPEPTATRPSR